MKAEYKVALAMVTSFALGAVAVQSLHAQAKPSSDEEKIAKRCLRPRHRCHATQVSSK